MEAENSESGGVFAHSGSGTVTTGLCISIVVSTHNIDTYVNVSYLYIYIHIYIGLMAFRGRRRRNGVEMVGGWGTDLGKPGAGC